MTMKLRYRPETTSNAARLLPWALLLLGAGCSADVADTDDAAEPASEVVEVGSLQQPLTDGDGLMVPEFIKPPLIPPELMKVFKFGEKAFPIISGALPFIQAAFGIATELDIAKQEIINQMIAIQRQELVGQLENEIQMFKHIAAQPCHPLSVDLYSQTLFATGQTFETMRNVVLSNNLEQSRGMALSMNVVGQLYLTLLRGSPEIGSPSCGGSLPGGIGPFNPLTMAEIAGKMKQANYAVIGAQQAYSTKPLFFDIIPAHWTTFKSFRQSKYYAAKGGWWCPQTAARLQQARDICGTGDWVTFGPLALGFCNPSSGQCSPPQPSGASCRFPPPDWSPYYESCLADVTKIVDEKFDADGLVSTLRAEQELLIGAFPTVTVSNSLLPVVPIPVFQEASATIVASPPRGFDVFYRSQAGNLIHTSGTNNSNIVKTLNRGGVILGAPAAQRTPQSLEVYAKGTDSVIYHQTGSPSSFFSGWTNAYDSTGLPIFGSPAAAPTATTEGRAVFGAGFGTRVPMAATSPAAPATPAWTALTASPAGFLRGSAAIVGSGGFNWIFGSGIDGQLQTTLWLGGSGLNLGSALGDGVTIGAPTALMAGDRLDIFAVGRKDGAVYHKGFNGSQWLPFESLGGVVISKPVAVSAFGAGRIDVFVLGTDHNLYQAMCSGAGCDGAGWNGYYHLGTTPSGIVGHPLVVSPGPNLIDIVVVDGSGRLYHKSWNGSSWFPSQTDFGSLAGDLVAID